MYRLNSLHIRSVSKNSYYSFYKLSHLLPSSVPSSLFFSKTSCIAGFLALLIIMGATNVGQVSVGTAKMIGFLLAICGNTLIACSLTLQKSAHNSLGDQPQDLSLDENDIESPPSESERNITSDENNSIVSPSSNLQFLRNPTWWIGTFLMAAGEIGNFAAFAFAPASLVAPLGAWSVVLSAILAHVFLHESISKRNVFGIVLCVVGACLIGAAGPDVNNAEASLDAETVTQLLIRYPFVVFMLLTLTATAILIYLSHRTILGQKYIFIYVGVSSLLGGVTVVCAKALSTFLRLTFEGNSQFGNVLPFVLGVTLAIAILAQLRYLNLAMSRFGNAQVIPVYYVLFTSCAMTSGVIMYREFDEITLSNIPFFLGICSTMSGVFLVSKSTSSSQTPLPIPSDDDARIRMTGRGKHDLEQDLNTVLPVSPVSSPRGNQESAW